MEEKPLGLGSTPPLVTKGLKDNWKKDTDGPVRQVYQNMVSPPMAKGFFQALGNGESFY